MDIFQLNLTLGNLQVNYAPREVRRADAQIVGRTKLFRAVGPYAKYSRQAVDMRALAGGTQIATTDVLDPNNPFSCTANAWTRTLARGRVLRDELLARSQPREWDAESWRLFVDWQVGHLDKLTLQRSRRPFWYFEDKPYSNEESAPPNYGVAVRAITDYLCQQPFKDVDSFRHGYHRGSNHGWPDMLSDDTSLLVHATVAGEFIRRHPNSAPSIEAASSALQTFSSEFGLPLPLGVTTFSRSGPRVKPLPITSVTPGGEIILHGESTGLFPRTRLVYGVSTWINLIGFRAYPAMAAAIAHLNLWHDSDRPLQGDLAALRARYKFVYNDDISSYDHSFSLEKLSMLATLENRVAQHCGLRGAGFEMAAVETMPILAPGFRPGTLAVTPRKGGLCSGRIDTTFIGCMGNVVRLLIIANRLFRVPLSPAGVHSLISGTGPIAIRVWGDDTIVFTNTPIDAEEWNDASMDLVRCPTELEDGPVFLMQYLGPDGLLLPSVGRQFQQRVANEHPYPGPMAVRSSCRNAVYSLLQRHPFQDELRRALLDLDSSCLDELTPDEEQQLAEEYGGAARAELEAILRREGAPSLQLEWAQDILDRLPPESPLDYTKAPESFSAALRWWRERYIDRYTQVVPRRTAF